jgi:hypothetical protein
VLLPVVKAWFLSRLRAGRRSGRSRSSKAGSWVAAARVIRDPAVHRQVLQDVYPLRSRRVTRCASDSFSLLGPKGNAEFLAWMAHHPEMRKAVEDLLNGLF